MSWWYNQIRGTTFSAGTVEEVALKASVWSQEHDPVPGQWLYGPFPDQAGAEAAKAAHPPISSAIPTPGDIAGAINSGVSQIGAFAVRAAEAVLGIVIIAVALNVIFRQATGVDLAAKGAKAARAGAATAAKAAA